MSSTSTIYADKGTWLDGDNVSTARGGTTTMQIGQQAIMLSSGERANSVLSFDVSSLTNPSVISQATLKFTNTGGGMFGSSIREIFAYRLDQDFTESECTWEIASTPMLVSE